MTYRWANTGESIIELETDGGIASFPPLPGNRHYDDMVAAGITPDPYRPPPVAPGSVKAEAQRRILGRFPEWKQRNMIARSVELTLELARGKPWTAEQSAEAAALQATWSWIGEVRAASDAIEAMKPLPHDYATDHRWPAAR